MVSYQFSANWMHGVWYTAVIYTMRYYSFRWASELIINSIGVHHTFKLIFPFFVSSPIPHRSEWTLRALFVWWLQSNYYRVFSVSLSISRYRYHSVPSNVNKRGNKTRVIHETAKKVRCRFGLCGVHKDRSKNH